MAVSNTTVALIRRILKVAKLRLGDLENKERQ